MPASFENPAGSGLCSQRSSKYVLECNDSIVACDDRVIALHSPAFSIKIHLRDWRKWKFLYDQVRGKTTMDRADILVNLKKYKEVNQKKYGIKSIGLFGSAARDTMNAESDIDIVVTLDAPDLFVLIGIKQDIEEKFGRPVDIVRKRDNMNQFLKKRIEREAIYV
jgi:predicted nucleotidyltransferase